MPAPLVRTKGPKRLRPQHFTMAALRAAGWKYGAIAKELGLSPDTVRATAMSPLFKLEVQRLTKRNVERISDNYVDQVLQDGTRNVQFMKDVRDGKPFDEPTSIDALRVRVDVAKDLLKRQVPVQKEGDAQPQINIVFQHNEQRAMAEACRDVGVRIPQLDDVIAEFREIEQDAASADA